MILALALWSDVAAAAEVVWLAPPADADRSLVAEQAAATGKPLEPVDLRAAATAWSPTDQAAYDRLDATLTEVRSFETKLDGELLIMRDLGAALSGVTLVRDDADRNKLFGALAYEGFAVNRYFQDGLATAEAASAYRVDLDGVVLELPWVDAVALDPTREVTAYEIAEAPQRVAYARVQGIAARALPATLTPKGLPPGATLKVDGRTATPGPAGNVKLTPGRHMIHVELEGRILARWDVRIGPGQAQEMAPTLDEATWTAFLDGLAEGASVPSALAPSIQALGGEVWLARPGEDGPTVFAVTAEQITAVKIERPATTDAEERRLLHAVVAAQGGWFYGADFLLQAPTADALDDRGRVNAGAVSALVAGDLDLSGFWLGAGVQTWVTLGEAHVARYAGEEGSTRLRPYPHLAAGVRYAQATAGFLFPYHPAVGLRGSLPIAGPVELNLSALYGFASNLPIGADSPTYESGDVRTVGGGVGLRF